MDRGGKRSGPLHAIRVLFCFNVCRHPPASHPPAFIFHPALTVASHDYLMGACPQLVAPPDLLRATTGGKTGHWDISTANPEGFFLLAAGFFIALLCGHLLVQGFVNQLKISNARIHPARIDAPFQ